MKVRLERDALAPAVAWVARSLPNRPSNPVLAGVALKADDSGLVLSSYDTDTSARIAVPAMVRDEGEILVSGRLLADIARSLPAKPVELSADDTKLELVCGSSRFTLQVLPLMEYPALPSLPESVGTVSVDTFAQSVAQVVVAAGRDELLPVFTAVRIEVDGDTVSMLATDRYRMALKEFTWVPAATQASAAALVPARVLSETAKSMTAGDEVAISLSAGSSGDGLIGFEGNGGEGNVRHTTTRLLDGDFPKVRHLMNIAPALTVRTGVADLIAAVRRVALVAERNTPVRMLIGDGVLTLEAATGDQAQASEAIEAVVDLHGASEPAVEAAGFNPNYLLDGLGALDAPYVHFSFTQPGKPCLLTALDDLAGEPRTDYRHVIMLMRLPNQG